MKKIAVILLCFFLININIISYAEELDEQIDYIWLDEEIKRTSINYKEEPILNSKFICAFDRSSKKVIYGKDENKKVPMASTTKIMTAIILMENLEKNGLTLDTEINVCKEAGGIHGSRLGLKFGDKIKVNDLLYGLMLCSRKRL